MANTYTYEHTDTFAGEANYSWVKRGDVTMPEIAHYGYDGSAGYARASRTARRELVRAVKARCGLTGVRCDVTEYDGLWEIRPRGMCQVVFVEYKES